MSYTLLTSIKYSLLYCFSSSIIFCFSNISDSSYVVPSVSPSTNILNILSSKSTFLSVYFHYYLLVHYYHNVFSSQHHLFSLSYIYYSLEPALSSIIYFLARVPISLLTTRIILHSSDSSGIITRLSIFGLKVFKVGG